MSYFDVICVIWCHMCHLMSNDAYDIKILHKSIWLILVSKEALGPQLHNLWLRFDLRNCFKMKWLKSAYGTFFLYKFWKSFVFLAHPAKTENDAGKLWELGKPSFLYIGMTYFLGGVIWCKSCKVGHPNAQLHISIA